MLGGYVVIEWFFGVFMTLLPDAQKSNDGFKYDAVNAKEVIRILKPFSFWILDFEKKFGQSPRQQGQLAFLFQ